MPRKKTDSRVPLVPDRSNPLTMQDGKLRTNTGSPAPVKNGVEAPYVWREVYSESIRATASEEREVAETPPIAPFLVVDKPMTYAPLAQPVKRYTDSVSLTGGGSVLSQQQFGKDAVTAAPREQVDGLQDPTPGGSSSRNRNFRNTAAMNWEGAR